MRSARMPRVMIAALLVGCQVAQAPATDATAQACRQEGQVSVCRTEGFGTIFGGDTAQARDEAQIDARRQAVEQAAGVLVDAETITRNQALFDQLVRTRTSGFIQFDRTLEEGPTGDGRYRMRIEAFIKVGEIQSRLDDIVSELSLVVLIPEENMGLPQSQPLVENEVVSRLVGDGYQVIDRQQAARIAQRQQQLALLRGDRQVARGIGLRFLSNLIVVGEARSRFSQNNAGLISAYARVTARAIEADTGRIVANIALDQVRGHALDQTSAGERALATAGKEAAEQFLQALDAHAKRKERRLEVRLHGLPSLDEYRRAKAFLEKQRWVSAVTEGGYAAGESVIVLTYPEKTLYLAARLGREPRYRVVDAQRSRIVVEYRP